MPTLNNSKWEVFAQEYLVDLNATQAAIRAGYSQKTAKSQGQRLLTNVDLQNRISELMEIRSEQTEINAVAVLKRWTELAMADPNELTSVIVGSCRFCHGTDHLYQWRDEGEFEEAQEAHFDLPDKEREKRIPPVIGGGFGYKWRKSPHEHCPRCDGFGFSRTVIRDTTNLSPGGQALFAGVKETQHGLEIKMHDQMAALTNVAKHLGMFVEKVEVSGGINLVVTQEDAEL
ncbi:MAG: terminase small subunit [Sulfitobacter sp.]